MSGPITRQYGVPNWDDIFGKKDDQPANPKMSNDPDNQDESSEQSKSPDQTDDTAKN